MGVGTPRIPRKRGADQDHWRAGAGGGCMITWHQAHRRVTGRIDRSIRCASDRSMWAASARSTRAAAVASSSRSSLVPGGASYARPSPWVNPISSDADRVIIKRPTWTASWWPPHSEIRF
ncbi:MAG: hypothetical protein KC464_19685, partial [Myxococcales bacterium]|nr:hypothetical protein [Myxococcales bacterium]